MTPRWEVQIIRPQDGRTKTFSTHESRAVAEIEAGKLRRHGLWAQVRRVADPDPDLLPKAAA